MELPAAAPSLDVTGTHRGKEFSLRWIMIHMIEEYARHNYRVAVLVDPITHDRPVTGTRDSDRPTTGLYLFCRRGQPVGITAGRCSSANIRSYTTGAGTARQYPGAAAQPTRSPGAFGHLPVARCRAV